jgi:hypothetical protein
MTSILNEGQTERKSKGERERGRKRVAAELRICCCKHILYENLHITRNVLEQHYKYARGLNMFLYNPLHSLLHILFLSELSTESDLVHPLSISSIISIP